MARVLLRVAVVLVASAVAAGAWAVLAARRDRPPPPGLTGTVVYVSDRTGLDALYARRLPSGEDRRLTFLDEPVREPALSPDGRRAAFAMGGRIGVVSLATGDVAFATVGVDWRDAAPSWRSDGAALLVTARRPGGGSADVHLLEPDPKGGVAARRALTDTPGLDETGPVFGPDDASVFFVRQDNVLRLDLEGARTRKLTAGFKTFRSVRLLPSGRVLCLWTEGKRYGMDVMDADGKNHETLQEGTIFYRAVAPSPDGRYFAATFTFDLGFHPTEVLRLRQPEELRLLDARGTEVAVLARSWRDAYHSADWR